MCASLGLFYVKGSGDLVPIAIQLHQQPSKNNPIWTPNDSELDWLCAKLWLRNSDTQFHQESQTIGLFAEYGHTVQKTPCWMAGWIFLLKSNNPTLLKSKMVGPFGGPQHDVVCFISDPTKCLAWGRETTATRAFNTPSVGALNLRSNELNF